LVGCGRSPAARNGRLRARRREGVVGTGADTDAEVEVETEGDVHVVVVVGPPGPTAPLSGALAVGGLLVVGAPASAEAVLEVAV
jgi:hypothetical protein